MPLISVIMPSYNHGKFIEKAINSVLSQTFDDFELIIIDDASNDNSREVIVELAEKDKRIRVVFHNKNLGIAKTFNEGIEMACGKYIAFIASDDKWKSDKLQKQVEILMKDENLAVWAEGLVIDEKDEITGEIFTSWIKAENMKKSGYILEELLQRNFIFGSSFIIKRTNLASIRFNEKLKFLNDWEFYVDIAKNYKYYFIPLPLAFYRIHGKNVTFSNRKKWNEERVKVRLNFLNKYKKDISTKTRAQLYYGIGRYYIVLENFDRGRKYIFKAVKEYPFKFRFIAASLLTIFGKNFHEKVFSIFRKLFNKLSSRGR